MSELLTLQDLKNGHLDVKSLGEAANGDEDAQVVTRTGETYPSAKKAIKILFENGGLPATPFETYEYMVTNGASLIDGSYAVVMDDSSQENGYYQKRSGKWFYLQHNPSALINAVAEIDDTDTDNIVSIKDVNGTTVFKTTRDGEHYFVGIDGDLNTAINRSATQDATSDNIFEQRDSEGSITLKQDKDGDLHTLKVGNVTQAILDLQENSGNSGSQKGINLEAAHLAGKYNDFMRAENVPNYNVTQKVLSRDMVVSAAIFTQPIGLIRIPAVSRIGKSKYLLGFEGRESLDDFGDISVGTAVIGIEPTTKAITVSNLILLHQSFTDSAGKLRAFMNPCSVKLDSGKIIILYIRRYAQSENELYIKTSTDDGASWSAHTDITSVREGTDLNLICPCSQGLIKRYGQHKGRIVFPVWITKGAAYVDGDYRSGYIYSDDEGITWEMGEFAPYGTANEVQIAEDLNGDMLFSIRLENRSPPKIIARHSDITKEYTTVVTNKQLTNEAIMSGFIQGENKYDRTPTKFMMSTCDTRDRKELLIHTSYTGGKDWVSYKLPSTINKKVAYSCIESLDPEHIFTLWEAEDTGNFDGAVISINNLIQEI